MGLLTFDELTGLGQTVYEGYVARMYPGGSVIRELVSDPFSPTGELQGPRQYWDASERIRRERNKAAQLLLKRKAAAERWRDRYEEAQRKRSLLAKRRAERERARVGLAYASEASARAQRGVAMARATGAPPPIPQSPLSAAKLARLTGPPLWSRSRAPAHSPVARGLVRGPGGAAAPAGGTAFRASGTY